MQYPRHHRPQTRGGRTHGLLLASAQAARAEADTANSIKDEFLATVSHELRTPLTSILGWSQMLVSGKLNEQESKRAVETILRNARAQREIIDDLLDISRIITGKLRLDVRSVELGRIIEAVVEGDAAGSRCQKHPSPDCDSIRE
jgi:signal transduction histidine kinase